jgi:hypothetical protein
LDRRLDASDVLIPRCFKHIECAKKTNFGAGIPVLDLRFAFGIGGDAEADIRSTAPAPPI